MYMTNKINKWFLSLLITIIETNVYAYDFEADDFCFNKRIDKLDLWKDVRF